MTAVKRVVLGGAFVDAEQVGERGGVEPLPVQSPLGAGGEQPVDDEDAQDFFPVGALAAFAKAPGEKSVEMELLVKCVGQETRAPLARMFQAQLLQAHAHLLVLGDGEAAARGGREVVGKERHLARFFAARLEDINGALPSALLAVVEFAQVEHMPVQDAFPDAS